MKKLLFLLLLGATAQAQITTRCAVCPPTLNGVPNGYALRDSSGFARWQFVANDTMTEWGLSGNAGTNPATNFIGTTDTQALVLKANNGGYPVAVFTNSSFSVADSTNDVDKFLVDVENSQSEFKTSLRIVDGTEGAGKVFTSDSAGYGSWQGGIIYDSLTALTGQTITLTNNSTYIIAASGTIVSVTWSFPAGVTGDVLDIENMQVITTLNITGTGTGTITAAKITNTKSAGLKTFHNYGGNWY